MSTIYASDRRIAPTLTAITKTPVDGKTITVEATSNDGTAVCITKTFTWDRGASETSRVVLYAHELRAIVAALDRMEG